MLSLDVVLVHNVTVSRDRSDNYFLFHHTFVPSASYRDYLGDMHFVTTIDRLTRKISFVCMGDCMNSS